MDNKTLQNGDYLPVSEIKTEQDFNDVIKASENCGCGMIESWRGEDFETYKLYGNVFIDEGGDLKHDPIDGVCKNKLTLTQWLERGGVKREEVKEWMPEVGELVQTSLGERVVLMSKPDVNNIIIVGHEGAYIPVNFNSIKPLPTPEEVEREEFRGFILADLGELNSCITDHHKIFDRMFDMGYRKTK